MIRFLIIAILLLLPICVQADNLPTTVSIVPRYDASFGTGGIVNSGRVDRYNYGKTMAIQADGKLVVTWYFTEKDDQSQNDFQRLLLLRFNSDGTADTEFGSNGVVTYKDDLNNYLGHSVAIQSDGKIVVAGEKISSLTQRGSAMVLRFNANGTPDNTFGDGTNIITYTTQEGYDSLVRAVSIQPDGKIVVSGHIFDGSYNDGLLLRYNASGGRLDSNFGNGGVVTYAGSINDNDCLKSVAIQPDGKIVVSGETYVNDSFSMDMLLLRYNSDGSLDTSFGSNGLVTFNDVANGNENGNSVVIQSDGKIVVAGYTSNASNTDMLVLRYNSNGTLDKGFGLDKGIGIDRDGFVTFNGVGGSDDFGYSVALQADGKIVVAGSSFNETDDLVVARFNKDGTPDIFFGSQGVFTYNSNNNNYDSGNSLAIQPDGKILVVGSSVDDSGFDNVLLLRLIDDTVPPSHDLIVKIIGSGTVNSQNLQGTNYACNSSTCPPMTFNHNDNVTLTATGSNSTFNSWRGDSNSNQNLVNITMDGNKMVTATFTANSAYARIEGLPTVYYSLDAVLEAAPAPKYPLLATEIRARALPIVFSENIIMINPVTIRLKGGYTDSGFVSQASYTTVSGSLKIRGGKLLIELLKIK